jgi:hypothetical protein
VNARCPFWKTWIWARVKSTSVICAVQLLLEHHASDGVGWAGELVVTLKVRLPFLTCVAGIFCVPVTAIEAGFCPGGPGATLVRAGSGRIARGQQFEFIVVPSELRRRLPVPLRPTSSTVVWFAVANTLTDEYAAGADPWS